MEVTSVSVVENKHSLAVFSESSDSTGKIIGSRSLCVHCDPKTSYIIWSDSKSFSAKASLPVMLMSLDASHLYKCTTSQQHQKIMFISWDSKFYLYIQI